MVQKFRQLSLTYFKCGNKGNRTQKCSYNRDNRTLFSHSVRNPSIRPSICRDFSSLEYPTSSHNSAKRDVVRFASSTSSIMRPPAGTPSMNVDMTCSGLFVAPFSRNRVFPGVKRLVPLSKKISALRGEGSYVFLP